MGLNLSTSQIANELGLDRGDAQAMTTTLCQAGGPVSVHFFLPVASLCAGAGITSGAQCQNGSAGSDPVSGFRLGKHPTARARNR
jgi:hypothetical protein